MDTDPLPPSRWWTQLHSLLSRWKNLTAEEISALLKPYLLGGITLIIGYFLILYLNRLPCNVSFSIESISISPSSTTWHVDFLVKNPSSRCPIHYDGDVVYVKLDPLNAAVLKTSHTRRPRGHTSFSVDLATSNQSDVVAASPRVFELDMRLGARKKQFFNDDRIGHFDIRCQNFMIGHEKIQCHSPFKELKECC